MCNLRVLARWAGCDPETLDEERIRDFFLHLIRDRQHAPQSLRQARVSLSAFYRGMLGRSSWTFFESVKTKDLVPLPVVLGREEVFRILREVRELRFSVPLRLIYLCGLRLSEALHIEVHDIQRKEGRLHIRNGKGGKGRYVPLPVAAIQDLEKMWHSRGHKSLLFPAMGQGWRSTEQRGEAERERLQRQRLKEAKHPMSASALQRVWGLALAASGVKKKATIHTLRHSYATHLLEEGVSLRYVSQYLGHANLNQTLVYLHLTEASEAATHAAVARLAAGLGGKR